MKRKFKIYRNSNSRPILFKSLEDGNMQEHKTNLKRGFNTCNPHIPFFVFVCNEFCQDHLRKSKADTHNCYNNQYIQNKVQGVNSQPSLLSQR